MIGIEELATEPAGQLSEPPRWPPTAIGTGEMPSPDPDARYGLPLLRRIALMMVALLLAVTSVGIAAAPAPNGPLAIAARTFVSGSLGAASVVTYRRASAPSTSMDVLRGARYERAGRRRDSDAGRNTSRAAPRDARDRRTQDTSFDT